MNKTKYERKYNKHYNYSGGIKCDDIKPMERKFFRYLMRQIDYVSLRKECENDISKLNYFTITGSVHEHVVKFSEKYNVPYKQLLYYLSKWERCGFYECGVSLDFGWFINVDLLIFGIENDKKSADISRYTEAIPRRVLLIYRDYILIPIAKPSLEE